MANRATPVCPGRCGIGAREGGGRWNSPGTAVIYTGRTITIVALEKLVHIAGVVPADLVLVRIELPALTRRKPLRQTIYPRIGMQFVLALAAWHSERGGLVKTALAFCTFPQP